MNLRQRLRPIGIKYLRCLKGEIELMPISAQTLFMNKGVPADILEIELKEEGYLNDDERLIEVLQENNGFNRRPYDYYENCDKDDYFPADWTDEDYQRYYEENKNDTNSELKRRNKRS